MTMNRHEPFEELISASLHGDLSHEERQRLDAHLDACDQCRATLAAFADQRRIVAGLRHVAPPRDLGARVRAGIEGGSSAGLPWWRRPSAMLAGVGGGLAVAAGGLLALVLLNATPDEPRTGNASPSPSTPIAASSTPVPTLPPAPTSDPVQSSPPTPAATPAETPLPASPEPDMYLALTGPFDNNLLTVRSGVTHELVTEVGAVPAEPIAAELSPDGEWLAHIVTLGASGMNEVRVTRVAGDDSPGHTISLGEGVAGGPFLEHMAWTPDGEYLAYTLADPAGDGTDVWIFEPAAERFWQRTDVGNAYAGSWVAGRGGAPALWVSLAGPEPVSYLIGAHDESGATDAGNPADSPFGPAKDVFQPLVSPNDAFVIYWTGRMERFGEEWSFSQAGAPWLAQNVGDGEGGYEFDNARLLFADVTIDRDAFTAAAITWGGDGDSYAVWDTDWAGVPQAGRGDYPDRRRVYFGHATGGELAWDHALDAGDIPADARVVDVKVSPTGRHLLITAARPRAGTLDIPRADLLLVTRNTGDVEDVVVPLRPGDEGWFGPAVFDGDTGSEAP